MIEKSLVLDGGVANLIYNKEKQEISVIYRKQVLYTGWIQPNHVIFTKDWIKEALLKSVVEHYKKKESSRLKLLAVAKELGWK